MDHRCKYKTSNSKPIEENIGENICKLELNKHYLCTIQKAQSIKEQIELHRNQNFCSSKDTAKRVSRQASGWEKYWQIIYI